ATGTLRFAQNARVSVDMARSSVVIGLLLFCGCTAMYRNAFKQKLETAVPLDGRAIYTAYEAHGSWEFKASSRSPNELCFSEEDDAVVDFKRSAEIRVLPSPDVTDEEVPAAAIGI